MTNGAKGSAGGAEASKGKDAAAEEESKVYYEETAGSKRPVVFERTERDDEEDDNGDDREYSSGLKDVQQVLHGFNRAAERLSSGLAEGFSTYREKSEESADKKKDGMLHDLALNMSEGFADGMSTMAEAPREIAKKLTPKRVRRLIFPFSD